MIIRRKTKRDETTVLLGLISYCDKLPAGPVCLMVFLHFKYSIQIFPVSSEIKTETVKITEQLLVLLFPMDGVNFIFLLQQKTVEISPAN